MHAELNRAPYNEQSHIRHHVQHRIDLFNRDRHKFTWLNFANKLPRALTEYAEGLFGRGAIESGCGTRSGLSLATGSWSFWRTEERRHERRGRPPEVSGRIFQVGQDWR